MDSEYKLNYTKDWCQLDGDKNLGLWSYWDNLEWKQNYCLMRNDIVCVVLDNVNPYSAYEIVKACI